MNPRSETRAGDAAPERDPRAEAPGDAAAVVAIRVGGAAYGLPVDAVLEVLRCPTPTRVPRVPEFVRGIVSVRSEIVPVLDLGLRFGGAAAAEDARLVLVHAERTGETVGLLVDAVVGVVPVTPEPHPPAEAEASLPSGLTRGVVRTPDGATLTLLDLDAVLELGGADAEAAHA